MNLKHLVAAAAACVVATTAHAGQWRYNDFADAMSGKSTHVASIESDNSLSLPFPYSGPNKGQLMVRKHPKLGTDVIFQIDKGQLMCSSYQPCNVSVKFDDKAPMAFKGLPPEDNDSKMTFLTSSKKFIGEATKASRILVQVTLFQSGAPVMVFTSPVPLAWKLPK